MTKVDLEIVKEAYAFTVADDGVVWGLTAGDMGYENTGIEIPVEDLQLWAKYNYKPEETESLLAANRDVMLHWEVLRADYDALLEKHSKLVFYLAHIDLYNTTEHDHALLESAIEEAKKEYFASDNV